MAQGDLQRLDRSFQTEARAQPAPPDGGTASGALAAVHAVLHAIGVFVHHLAAVHWQALGIAVGCHLVKLCAVSRAWRNVVAAAYSDARVSWLRMLGAYVAGTGVNAIIPARGGDVVKLAIAKRALPEATYTTLASTIVLMPFE